MKERFQTTETASKTKILLGERVAVLVIIMGGILSLFSLAAFITAPLWQKSITQLGEPYINQNNQLITLPGTQTKPKMFNQYIVYEDYRNWTNPLSRNTDIYRYNLNNNTETQITTNTNGQNNPDIYGNYIVWEDCRRYNFYDSNNRCSTADIYGFDMTANSEFQITDSIFSKYDPAIFDNKVVWAEQRPNYNQYDIILYDISTGARTQLTSELAWREEPDIYGNYVVWEQTREGYTIPDIYLYNLLTNQTQVISSVEIVFRDHPAIYGNKVVWAERRPGYNQYDIILYDISTGARTQLTSELAWREEPDIYGNYVVWEQTREGYTISDIYLYYINSGQINIISSSEIVNNKYPSIYNNKIVWQKGADLTVYNITNLPMPK